MPRGIPNIITNYDRNKEARKEAAAPLPEPELLGHIAGDAQVLNPDPESQRESATWQSEDGTHVTLTEPPPPWEVGDDSGYSISDARRFVDVPKNWRLHWINPKALSSEGWRDWQAVQTSDPRVTLKVPTMKSPEGYVRRGGAEGDILCWMWSGWYESKKRLNEEAIRLQSQKAVEKQQDVAESMARGKYGPYIRPDAVRHPTHTNADGRSMRE
ncbi:MAG TPA: hypothetical protein VFD73_05595 [Gemmatimonadales bacterium]|nr:hypothetical protein [Gemmatimonadales bacterium]